MIEEYFACTGKDHASRLTIQQHHANLGLKIAYLPT
jgi:hypothetical protein